MNKKELAEKIRKSSELTNEEKADLLGLLNRSKKYGLVWEEKTETVEEELRSKIPVLIEIKERGIVQDYEQLKSEWKSKNDINEELFEDSQYANNTNFPLEKISNHVLIEGDNLHALTVLNYTHAGKIDVIYIDPPYNTGNKDFKYNDTFVDKEDGFRHSKWLSFMHRRLKLAKSLLSNKGVIFISIDNNEFAQLKMLCDAIFKENNFISLIVWSSKTGAADAETIDNITEYVLIYVRDQKKVFAKNHFTYDLNRYKCRDKYFSERGPYYLDNLDRGGLKYSDSMNFAILGPNGESLFPNGRLKFEKDGWTWKWGKEKVEWGFDNDFLVIEKSKKKKSGWAVKYKTYLLVDNENIEVHQSTPIKNTIDDVKTGDGASDLKAIFHSQVFKYSKPVALLTKLLKMYEGKDIWILDFFAGSGTTLHATMQLNADDGGNRRCILVTNNESNICEEVTYERSKRVIEGYTTPKGKKVDGLKFNNLRYYKTEFIDRERTIPNKKHLVRLCTEMLKIKEDCYIEKEFSNLPSTVARLFETGDFFMMIIYNDEYIEECVEEIKKLDKFIKVYVFSNGQYPFTDDFEDVIQKVELCAIPDAIYHAFNPVLPGKEKVKQAVSEEFVDYETEFEDE
jgi:adenine-specific DNA-methyltransferase